MPLLNGTIEQDHPVLFSIKTLLERILLEIIIAEL
jgi:hypothetical protein